MKLNGLSPNLIFKLDEYISRCHVSVELNQYHLISQGSGTTYKLRITNFSVDNLCSLILCSVELRNVFGASEAHLQYQRGCSVSARNIKNNGNVPR